MKSFRKRRLTDTEKLILHMKEELMAAIDDLSASIDALGAAVTAEVAALADALSKVVLPVDDSVAIEAQVARVNAAAKALSDSLAPPVVAAPVVDAPAPVAVPTDAPTA